VRELPGPPGAPILVLLHGWVATADINWFPSFDALSRRFRVLAMDLRGHGRGIHASRPFRLRDCADDAIALADVLEVERCIPVGYSMGGTVAQLIWHRHRERVDGLVLCATAGQFSATREEGLLFAGVGALAHASRLTPRPVKRRLSRLYLGRRGRRYDAWASEQIARHDWTKILDAGREIGRFSSRPWSGEIDVPTAVLITMRDRVVPLRRQIKLFESIPGALAYRLDGDHDACVVGAERFVPTLVSACTSVAEGPPARSTADHAVSGSAAPGAPG
jgi:pimeloyl-ACP methyl ester carboxylesterase